MTAEPVGAGVEHAGELPWWPLIGMITYVVLAAALLFSPLLPDDQRLLAWVWSTAPAHATTIGCGLFTASRGHLTRRRRMAWSFSVAALTLSFIGTALWAWDWTRSGSVAPYTDDVVYLLAYPSLGMLGLYFFLRDLGGPVRRVGVLLDALVLALGFGAALWCFVIVPTAPAGADALSVLDATVRSVLLILPAVLAGIVYTHVSDWSEERGLGCLLVAAVLALCGDLLWAGREIPDRLDQAAAYNLVYLGANIVATLAMGFDTRRRAAAAPRPRAVSYSLMPALIILGCLIALIAAETPLAAPPQSVALGMLIVATAVLAIRESIAHRERRQLERERDAAASVLNHETSDRARLFDQVHEGVAQELAGLQLSLGASSRDPALASDSLRSAMERLGETITHTREFASRLAPLQSARGSLRLALTALQSEAHTAGLPCELEIDALDLEDATAPAAAELAYRVVRHALETAATDASLRSLRIEVVPGDEALAIDAHARSQASGDIVLYHPGWPALRDRLQVVGASMADQATPDGWRLTVRLPRAGAPSRGTAER